MSSRSEQSAEAERIRRLGQSYFKRGLRSWERALTAEWTPGTQSIPPTAEDELIVILRRGYDVVANDTLRTEWRVYKQDEEERDPFDEAMIAIAAVLAIAIPERVREASRAILSTVREFMRRASIDADAAEVDTVAQRTRVARRTLERRLRNHRLIIARTETGFMGETTRRTAILSVNDPLGNSVERIADLIERGDINAAKRLSRRVVKLANLPNSTRQGQLIRYVNDARDRLVTPLAQGRIVATLRDRAQKLGRTEKVWHAIFRNTRPSHAAAHGQTRPAEEPFELEDGLLQYPMDGSLGAPLSTIINCFPGWQPVTASPVAVIRRFYEGQLITIETMSGKKLTVTPNHPVLGESGWIAAHLVKHGMSVACGIDGKGLPKGSDVQRREPTAEQIYDSAIRSGDVVRYHRLAVNLHGERPDGDVDVVYPNGKLRDWFKVHDPFHKLGLTAADLAERTLLRLSPDRMSSGAEGSGAHGVVSSRGVRSPFSFAELRHSVPLGFAPVSTVDLAPIKNESNATSVVSDLSRDLQDRRTVGIEVAAQRGDSPGIAFEPVSRVSVETYFGWVYNVHDQKGYMVGNGIVNHNCQCWVEWR
mgnify:CR=1 FL=1